MKPGITIVFLFTKNGEKSMKSRLRQCIKKCRFYKFVGAEDLEKEGDPLFWDKRLVRDFIKKSLQGKVCGHHANIKNDHYIPWSYSTTQQKREKIEAQLSNTIPKAYWPNISRYFANPKKIAESERNKKNCNSETDRPCSTLGPIGHEHKKAQFKYELKGGYNVSIGWNACHMSNYDPKTDL